MPEGTYEILIILQQLHHQASLAYWAHHQHCSAELDFTTACSPCLHYQFCQATNLVEALLSNLHTKLKV